MGRWSVIYTGYTFKILLSSDLPVFSVHGGGGITAHTPTTLPYIDQTEDEFTICLGGNGHAAKSSYEIGRLATELALNGKWDDKFKRDELRV